MEWTRIVWNAIQLAIEFIWICPVHVQPRIMLNKVDGIPGGFFSKNAKLDFRNSMNR